jgi:ribosomal protein S18 acetylase RimI-like enzyme
MEIHALRWWNEVAILSHDRVGREGLTMPIEFREAIDTDASEIVRIKQSVWPDENANPAYVAAVIRNSGHTILVAIDDNEVVGFVDGFTTTAANGKLRWEVDLLGVHPEHQGLGIATKLVGLSTNAAHAAGASIARALVGVENTLSERTFARCTYIKNPEPHGLYVSSRSGENALSHNAHLLSVMTMNYVGIWIEGDLSLQGFVSAQTHCAHNRWDVAGAVIPLSQTSALQAAQKVGYTLVGHYHWWRLDLDKA